MSCSLLSSNITVSFSGMHTRLRSSSQPLEVHVSPCEPTHWVPVAYLVELTKVKAGRVDNEFAGEWIVVFRSNAPGAFDAASVVCDVEDLAEHHIGCATNERKSGVI